MLIKNGQLLSALYSIALVGNTKDHPPCSPPQLHNKKPPTPPKKRLWTSGNVTAQIVTSIYTYPSSQNTLKLILMCHHITYEQIQPVVYSVSGSLLRTTYTK